MKYPHIAVAVAVAAGLPLGSAAVHAQPEPVFRYVAMGSSYAAGPGIAPQVDAGCLRSGNNYPQLLAHRIGADLVDVSCSGATTANITGPQRLTNGATVGPQIDAVTADTSLVTITIGGNDLGLLAGMIGRSCGPAFAPAAPGVAAALSDVCGQVLGGQSPTATDQAEIEHALVGVVRAVRARAPHADVLLVQYLPALDPRADTCPGVDLTPADAARARRTYDELVTATDAAAEATGATSVQVPDAEQHSACSSIPWTNRFHNPLETGDIASLASSYHPNPAGMRAVADHLAEILDHR